MMKACKQSIFRTLRAVAATVLLLPQLALAEVGVCPPYEKSFGPGDAPSDILSFINELNARPGGGTVVLEPGVYGTRADWQDLLMGERIPITGVICIRANDMDAERPRINAVFGVHNNAVLTLRRVVTLEVGVGGTLFAHASRLDAADEYGPIPYPALFLSGRAFVYDTEINVAESYAGSTLVMNGGRLFGMRFGGAGLMNWGGRVLLDNVWVHNNGFIGILNEYDGTVSVIRSSILTNGECGTSPDPSGPECWGTGIWNAEGYVEVGQSVVAENTGPDCNGSVYDLGYNVFGTLDDDGHGVPDACVLEDRQPTTLVADPVLCTEDVGWGVLIKPELCAGSPAIDLIPLELSTPEDGLGRARTDGNNDGIVAADAGAREYGYVSVEVTVRTTPYWRSIGKVDLTRTNALFIAVMSGGPIDPTSILFDSIAVGDFPSSAMRGVGYGDKNGDGLPDYNFWYRLDRALVLECRDYDEPFSALTDDGQQVTGRLRFEVVGCTG